MDLHMNCCSIHVWKHMKNQANWWSLVSAWRRLDAPAWAISHYNDVIMGVMASQIASLTIVYSTVHSDADQRKHQSSASLAFVRGINRWPVNSPHKWPVTRKMFPFDDVIMGMGDIRKSYFSHVLVHYLERQVPSKHYRHYNLHSHHHCHLSIQSASWQPKIYFSLLVDFVFHLPSCKCFSIHYTDVIMTTMASQITSLTVVYSTVYSDADQGKHQSSAPLAFVWGIHWDRWISRTKGQLRGKCLHLMTSSCAFQSFPFDWQLTRANYACKNPKWAWPRIALGNSSVENVQWSVMCRLLHGPDRVAIWLSVVWDMAFNLVCCWLSKYRLGKSSHAMHYRFTWSMGVSTILKAFDSPLPQP